MCSSVRKTKVVQKPTVELNMTAWSLARLLFLTRERGLSSRRCTEHRYCSIRLSPRAGPQGPPVSVRSLETRRCCSGCCPAPPDALPGNESQDSGISVWTGVSEGMLGSDAELSRSFTDDCHCSTTWSWYTNTDTTMNRTRVSFITVIAFIIFTPTCFHRSFTASSCTRLCSRSSSCCLRTLQKHTSYWQNTV